MKKYFAIVEQTPDGTFGAYAPDLPGCGIAGAEGGVPVSEFHFGGPAQLSRWPGWFATRVGDACGSAPARRPPAGPALQAPGQASAPASDQ